MVVGGVMISISISISIFISISTSSIHSNSALTSLVFAKRASKVQGSSPIEAAREGQDPKVKREVKRSMPAHLRARQWIERIGPPRKQLA